MPRYGAVCFHFGMMLTYSQKNPYYRTEKYMGLTDDGSYASDEVKKHRLCAGCPPSQRCSWKWRQ